MEPVEVRKEVEKAVVGYLGRYNIKFWLTPGAQSAAFKFKYGTLLFQFRKNRFKVTAWILPKEIDFASDPPSRWTKYFYDEDSGKWIVVEHSTSYKEGEATLDEIAKEWITFVA